jgi:hypothetical protein
MQVFPGSEERPRPTAKAHYYVNGNLVYRSFDHPDGPSSIPWFVIRSGRVLPAEGYPGGSARTPKFRVEQLPPKGRGVTIRPIQPRDYTRGGHPWPEG